MKQAMDNYLIQLQRHGLNRSGLSHGVDDLHCRYLPGLGDGPSDLVEALSLCRVLASGGITAVVAVRRPLGGFISCFDAGIIRQGPCVTGAFDTVVQYRGRTLACQSSTKKPMALIVLLGEHHMECSKEGRA